MLINILLFVFIKILLFMLLLTSVLESKLSEILFG